MARITIERKIKIYADKNGREPFTEWMQSICDSRTNKRIRARLDRLALGNWGDCQSVGGGIYELRMFFGPGYRVYFSETENAIMLLLCGGDKSSQSRDIKRAKGYLADYRRTKQ